MSRFKFLEIFFFAILSASVCAAPHPCEDNNTGFIAFGDFGMGNKTQKKVAQAMKSFCKTASCEFALLLGDNIYPDGVESPSDPQWKKKFEEPYADFTFPFYPTLGNHDYHGNIEAQLEYSKKNKQWKMPARYYSFKKCHSEFFVIDTEDFDEEQMDWLELSIQKSKATWKIVYGHRPIFSHGGHGNNLELKKTLLPIIKNRVDLYLAGHDHHLEYISRGYSPDHIVSGSAAESRPVGSGKTSLYAESVPGFSSFDLDKKKARIRFLNESGQMVFEHMLHKPRRKRH